MKTDLLETVYHHSKEDCISDLRDPNHLRKHIHFIMSISDEAFSVEQWEYMYAYITGEQVHGTIAEIKQLFKKWVK